MTSINEEILYGLTAEGLEHLRVLGKHEPQRVWESTLAELTSGLDEYLTATDWDLSTMPDLKLPSGKDNFDIENSKLFYSAMSHLSPLQAADERFWVSLTLGKYKAYTTSRWVKASNVSFENHVKNHIFGTTSRNRFRDQALARLWWIGRFIERNISGNSDKAYSVLLDLDTDIVSNYLGRPNLVALPGIAKSVIDLTYEAFFTNGKRDEYVRRTYRNFIMAIDLENGRQLISHKSESEMALQVRKLFELFFPGTLT